MNRPIPYKEPFWNTITVEMSLDQQVNFRRVYSVLDWARDIGGVLGSLKLVFGTILVIINYYSA